MSAGSRAPRHPGDRRAVLAVCGLVAALIVSRVVPEATPGPAVAQQGTPASGGQAAPPDRPATFRVEANYVRVDAYVTRDGAPVTDLDVSEFEVLEDGVPQTISDFELVDLRGASRSAARLDPSTTTEARALAEDPRRRVIVLFLDTDHMTTSGSHRARTALVAFLQRLIGPDDLVGVMTPDMAAGEVALSGRTDSIEEILDRHWAWGRKDQPGNIDSVEADYLLCYPEVEAEKECTLPNGRRVRQPPGFYGGVAREMMARRREERTLTAFEDLVTWLRGIREERKAVLAVSTGWRLFRPDDRLTRVGPCDTDRIGTEAATGHDPRRPPDPVRGGHRSLSPYLACEADRTRLAHLDNDRTFRELLDRANRANVSFYPVDLNGLTVFDTSMADVKASPDGVLQPALTPSQSMRAATARTDSLRTLAMATDGMAVVNTNDVESGIARISADLSAYYLLGYFSGKPLDGKYRKLTVRVTRPGTSVRARRGYLAPTAEEVAAAAPAPAAPAGAEHAALESAIASLASLAGPLRIRSNVACVGAALGGGSEAPHGTVWLDADIDPTFAASADVRNGARVESTITKDGAPAGPPQRVEIAPGQRSVTVAWTDAPVAPGEYVVRMHVTPAGGGTPLRETVRVVVPPGELVVGMPRVFRAPAPRALPFQATGDLRFRRNERVRVDVPVSVDVEDASAELLDGRGAPLPVPASLSRHQAEGLTWVAAEVRLAPLAEGDYAVRTTVRTAGRQHVRVAAFRVVAP